MCSSGRGRGREPGDGGGVSAAGDFSLVAEWDGAVFLL